MTLGSVEMYKTVHIALRQRSLGSVTNSIGLSLGLSSISVNTPLICCIYQGNFLRQLIQFNIHVGI